jgi:nucleoside-diphosphate-sugar epimerase
LIYVSSIAALFLGARDSIVTSLTEADPYPQYRSSYAQAKAEAEGLLLALYRDRSLPVCILRPGIVVGEGGVRFHSGLGFFNSDRHCMGWNRGRHPLPFVLVEDVADAILRALKVSNVVGHCYNLVGDVRLSAREYLLELAQTLERPLQYHPQSVYKLFAVELTKHFVKRLIGHRDPRPTLYDLRSRGLVASIDCADTVRDLGWHPVASRGEFLRAALGRNGRLD